MNRTIKADQPEPPSQLMGTLAVMGFAAGSNLRDVAQALGKRDLEGLKRVAEKNAKQARLRAEIEEQIAVERARPAIGLRDKRKLAITSRIAVMFERMGDETVEISELCRQIIRDSKPSRVTEIKKLIEHALYIADRAVSGFVDEDIHMVKIAQDKVGLQLNSMLKSKKSSLRCSLPIKTLPRASLCSFS